MRKISTALFLAMLAAGAASAATGTTTNAMPASVYARAEAVLPQHIGELVFDLSVRPTWIGDGARFWFVKHTRHGREYVYVDPARGVMRPLFDQAKLSDALGKARVKAVSRKDFRLGGLQVDEHTGELRFDAGGRHWRYAPTTNALASVTEEDGVASPDGRWRAVVRDGNLFVIDGKDGSTRALTADGTPDAPYATPVIDPSLMIAADSEHPALPADIAWSPDSRRIATYRLDTQGARRMALVQSTPPGDGKPRVFDYVYPMAGDTIVPRAQGMVFDVASGKRIAMQLPPEPVLYYGGPGFAWSRDGTTLFERVPMRGDKAMDLYRIDAATGAASSIAENRSDTYVDTYAHSWYYDDKTGTNYWSDDATGWKQLYAIDGNGDSHRRAITSGQWRAWGVEGIDHADGRLLIAGSGREPGLDPYLCALYSTAMDGSHLRLLTPEPLNHDVSVSPDGRYFVDNMSLVNRPTRSVLRSTRDGRIVMQLDHADASAFLAAGYRFPQPFEATAADGKTRIYGAYYLPADFDPAKRYPVIEDVYTGPHYVMTPKSFEAALAARNDEAMAQLGAVALMIDGRGTAGRSRAFQQPAYRNLHAVGLDDHVAGIREMAASHPWIDAGRVGIYGFSAGGYDVVRALEDYPDFYTVGVAASGNHDNRIDKADWNEQWLGSTLDASYAANSNIRQVDRIRGRLMVAFGEVDNNVPPSESLRLVDALMKANKDFQMLTVPNADHFLDNVPYYQRRRWDFLVENLLREQPPEDYRMRPFD
ncbi:prolyl oligopeptidase family serine peptidase [Rhodanobacter sp. DHB23]|uniref:S9 family peptidase n=1 Tax=Rhodanobacter sp. DHB23 TaxID=2775923 RepID=UPI001780191F|nr:prolyl oligopeptidase family serine peptidase [Rhodanobacter sp. DHB23]MBD8872149.1 prolyl oligopeptidase family serine peptidase [Rhodanobacter sp. DHB23]